MTSTNRLTDPKQRGDWAELTFMARAAREGLLVSRPFGECRYDVGVEYNGNHKRVQVKSSLHRRRNRSYCLHVRTTQRQPYHPSDIDFLAAYLIQVDQWYILPVEQLWTPNGPISALHITPEGKQQKWKDYKEAWHLLRGETRPNEQRR